MAKTVKKVDVKKATKGVVSAKIAEVFKAQGIEVSDGQEYGFTEGTLVLHMEKCDVR
jgi:hypothetical protein